jgi:hypothetical protein
MGKRKNYLGTINNVPFSTLQEMKFIEMNSTKYQFLKWMEIKIPSTAKILAI